MTAQTLLTNINSALTQLDNTQQELSTGKKINQPSDDPYGASLAIQLNGQLSQLSNYSDNINDGTAVALWDERPLRPGREARAAAAAQPGILDGRDHVVGLHLQGLFQRLVTVVAAVGLESPRFGVVPKAAQHRSQRRW